MIRLCLRSLLCVMMIVGCAWADQSSKLSQYVESLLRESSTLMQSKLSPDQRNAKIKELLAKNINFERMGADALGVGYKKLQPEQKKSFNEAYKKYMIRTYTNIAQKYNNQKIEVTKVEQIDNNHYNVCSSLHDAQGNVMQINYLVENVGDRFLVYDIITSGLSMVNMQRAEFSSTLQSAGIDILIQKLN